MNAKAERPAGRIAGIDYGTVRIGIALTDSRQLIPSPFETYRRRGDDADLRYFQQLVADERIALFVVGLPVHLDGRESKKSAEVRRFGGKLAETTGVPVEYFDERFTTAFANEMLVGAGLTGRDRKDRLDKLAAQILLTAYLERGERVSGEPEPLDD